MTTVMSPLEPEPLKRFTITELDIENLPDEFYDFCEDCEAEGMLNNTSTSAMRMSYMGVGERWWVAWCDERIVGIAGAHHMPQLSPGCWRIAYRTATLKEYRGKAGPIRKDLTHDVSWGQIAPLQYEYAKSQGADLIVFTTNAQGYGDANSQRTGRIVGRAFTQIGITREYATGVDLYNTKQDVWEIVNMPNQL